MEIHLPTTDSTDIDAPENTDQIILGVQDGSKELDGEHEIDHKHLVYEESSGDICTAHSSRETWINNDDDDNAGNQRGGMNGINDTDTDNSFICWNPGQDGPISRGDFNQYQSHIDNQLNKLRKQRDEIFTIYQNERNKSKQEAQRSLEKKYLTNKLAAERVEKWKTMELRGKGPNEPVWLSSPSPASGAESPLNNNHSVHQFHSSNAKRSFIYDNVIDAGYELKVRTLLLRSSIAVESGFLDKAQSLISDALETAKKLDYFPIEAKCKYWEAVVLHSQGRHGEAAREFAQSRPCVGRYMEGEKVDSWLEYYQGSAFNSPTVVDSRALATPGLPYSPGSINEGFDLGM